MSGWSWCKSEARGAYKNGAYKIEACIASQNLKSDEIGSVNNRFVFDVWPRMNSLVPTDPGQG